MRLTRPKGASVSGDDFWQPKTIADKNLTVHFYKLHGSLHFQVVGTEVRLKERPYTKQAGTGLKFTIIPPESHKEYDKGVFATLWSKASEAINRSEHIVLIGYSMPATDLHQVRYLEPALREEV